MTHKFQAGDYVRAPTVRQYPGRVYVVHSVTPSGLPRAEITCGIPKALRHGTPATREEWEAQCESDRLANRRIRLRYHTEKAGNDTIGDVMRDLAAREWLIYRGWTLTLPPDGST